MTTLISKLLIFSAVFSAAYVFICDFNRSRFYKNAPQAAPKRIMPEVHLLIAAMLFTGHIVRMPWYISAASAALYLIVAYLVAPFIIARLADRFAFNEPGGDKDGDEGDKGGGAE